jgi:hypothetical protein
MSKRWLNNFMAVCVVALILTALVVLGGCQTTTIRMTSTTMNDTGQITQKSTMDIESVPRDWKDLYFRGYNVTLRAGAAAVAENPWTDIVGDIGSQIVKDAVCTQNPLLKRCVEGAQ